MTPTSPTPTTLGTSLSPIPTESLCHQVLASLAQHCIATTSQLRRMLRPDGTRQLLSRVLNKLRSDGFVDFTALPDAGRSRTHAWYLTYEGARLTRDLPVLRGRPPCPITSTTAASLKTPHTRAAVRAHLAFAEDARRLDHEHGPWDWTSEVSHSVGEGERVVADAHVLHRHRERTAAKPPRVRRNRPQHHERGAAGREADHARLFQHETQPVDRRKPAATGAAWLRWYPDLPRVLFVLTGAPRTRLENRMSDPQAMVAHHPLVAAFAGDVRLGAAVLEDLEQAGPSQPVWVPLPGGKPRPWTEL
ncbi:replication-relaxation family protein [Streptomyces sp. NPDC101149]|uniref:replication-relaxation family protein n=1 Tax=Streptomyces sp. NPDC101149 TaxID=3366113 RepID=UPI0037F6A8C7